MATVGVKWLSSTSTITVELSTW